jgi:polyisoprenoid-binding protein YceI
MKLTSYLPVFALLIGCQSEIDNKTAAEVAAVEAPAAKPAQDAPAAADADATPSGALKLLPSSKIEFVGAKVTDDHTGGFTTLSGHATVADNTVKGATIEIDVSSMYSDHPKLTKHLKSDDFFDVSKFTTATFKITEVAAGEGGQSNVTGTLDLHGVQKQISFPATVETTEGSASISAEFTLMRMDFGITYPGKPDNLIRDEVLVKGTLSFGS